MAKKTQPRKSGKQTKKKQENLAQQDGWISQKNGVVIIGFVSVALAVWTTIQIAPALGWGEGLLWGVGFGAGIWVVFFGFQRFSRWLRGR